jgi:hypothetical protein
LAALERRKILASLQDAIEELNSLAGILFVCCGGSGVNNDATPSYP